MSCGLAVDRQVQDLGAGTGKFTKLLQALAAHSTAPWWLNFPLSLGVSLLLFASCH